MLARVVSFEIPDRNELLSQSTPTDMFGAAAGDPRALRRIFAKILKAYPPGKDPEVASHVRAIYEEARSGGAAPAEDAPVRLHAVPAGAESPAELAASSMPARLGPLDELTQAYEDEDFDAVLNILVEHRERLIHHAPHQWLGFAVQFGIGNLGVTLQGAQLVAVERFIGDPRLELNPQLICQIEGQLERIKALHGLNADASFPDDFRAMMLKTYAKEVIHVGELWVGWRDVAIKAGVDINALLGRVERHHPTVFGLMTRQEFHMEQLARHGEVGPNHLARTRLEPHVRSRSRRSLAPATSLGFPWSIYAGGLFAICVPSILSGRPLLLVVGVLGWTLVVRRRGIASRLRRSPGLHTVAALLTRAGRKAGLFPGEIVYALAPEKRIEMSDDVTALSPYSDAHPLIHFVRRPDATLMSLAPAHFERMEKGLAVAEAAEAAAAEDEDEDE
jgi:hypothetical protein